MTREMCTLFLMLLKELDLYRIQRVVKERIKSDNFLFSHMVPIIFRYSSRPLNQFLNTCYIRVLKTYYPNRKITNEFEYYMNRNNFRFAVFFQAH